MTLVVEDGTGTNPLANSYASVADFKSYWADRGFVPTGTPPQADVDIETALVRAATFLERYRWEWYGYELLPGTQPLGWPRQCVVLGCTVLPALPSQVVRAQIEYAKRELLLIPIQPDTSSTDSTNQIVQETTKQVGPITKTIKYVQGGARLTQSFPSAEQWLIGLKADYSGDAIR